jgi:hypothetical protein
VRLGDSVDCAVGVEGVTGVTGVDGAAGVAETGVEGALLPAGVVFSVSKGAVGLPRFRLLGPPIPRSRWSRAATAAALPPRRPPRSRSLPFPFSATASFSFSLSFDVSFSWDFAAGLGDDWGPPRRRDGPDSIRFNKAIGSAGFGTSSSFSFPFELDDLAAFSLSFRRSLLAARLLDSPVEDRSDALDLEDPFSGAF